MMGESRTCEFTDQLISLFFGDACKLAPVPKLVSGDKFGDSNDVTSP